MSDQHQRQHQPQLQSGRERRFRHRKVTDRAMVLPLLGVLALLPPFANIFELDTRIAGVPLTGLYLFVVWGLLIFGAARLARPLREHDESILRRPADDAEFPRD